jgi:hypothetical protein
MQQSSKGVLLVPSIETFHRALESTSLWHAKYIVKYVTKRAIEHLCFLRIVHVVEFSPRDMTAHKSDSSNCFVNTDCNLQCGFLNKERLQQEVVTGLDPSDTGWTE